MVRADITACRVRRGPDHLTVTRLRRDGPRTSSVAGDLRARWIGKPGQGPAHPRSGRLRMHGWLMWGLFLPILLVIAGIVTLRRKKGR
ncbi:hypothetical protein KRMM14A1259_62700 [Krasilnikovia sp. MM14-A1259]